MFILMPMLLLFLRDGNMFIDPVWTVHGNEFERNGSKATC